MNSALVRLSAEESKLLTRVTTLGAATSLPIVMTPSELVKLIGVIYRDVGAAHLLEEQMPGMWVKINPGLDYYAIEEDWFLSPVALSPFEHVELMRLATRQIADFPVYLRCLSELHKRRRKYSRILASQPMPTMVQVSPRALVEYGCTEPAALASWLTWRKFFYDLDNRSAQETGYLFEPILAAAIGGEPRGARARVVKRRSDPSKGRQVDCWKVLPEGPPLAYEFKLRVTIAASGQGRFGEEVSFADDCVYSGASPRLVVLDPTPNPRLSDLVAAFRDLGGEAYVGPAAWAHLEQEAGKVMAGFIERYVRQPVSAVSAFETPRADSVRDDGAGLLPFSAEYRSSTLCLRVGTHERRISRHADPSLAEEEGDEGVSEDSSAGD